MVAGAEAKANSVRNQSAHRLEALGEFRQQRRARGRDQFVRLIALGDADTARAEDGQCGWRGHREREDQASSQAPSTTRVLPVR